MALSVLRARRGGRARACVVDVVVVVTVVVIVVDVVIGVVVVVVVVFVVGGVAGRASATRRINELYYASVDTTPRVQKTLSLIYPNLKSQLGDRHYMLLRRSAEGSPPGL